MQMEVKFILSVIQLTEKKFNAMIEELRISRDEMVKLLSESFQIGFKKAMELSQNKKKRFLDKDISQNRAHELFTRSRVENWVRDGLILGVKNGNGKNSTVFYEYAKLMELDASKKIVIRKPYNIET